VFSDNLPASEPRRIAEPAGPLRDRTQRPVDRL